MTERPFNQTPETILVDYASRVLGFNETEQLRQIRTQAGSAETNEQYVEQLTRYQDAANEEVEKQNAPLRNTGLIAVALISAGIKYTYGNMETFKEALEDAFYGVEYNGKINPDIRESVKNQIALMQASVNEGAFDLKKYISSRDSFKI